VRRPLATTALGLGGGRFGGMCTHKGDIGAGGARVY
jgi:hypothetical protein